MAAEAANEKGIPGEAIDYLEQVRAHARGADSSIPVSYTHLDVYKRQVWNRAAS